MQKLKFTLPKNSVTSLIARIITLLVISGVSLSAHSQSVSINGPSSVCPNQQYTFTASSSGVVFPCYVAWYVLRNGVVIAGPGGNSSFTYTFDDVLGPVTVRAVQIRGIGCGSSTIENKTVNITYKAPGPISGPEFICFGQTKSFSTVGLGDTFEDCFFHHKYRWTVPTGWKVEGLSGSYTGPKSTVSIQAPSSGTDQLVQIKVEGYIDDPGVHVYTPATTYNVRLGKPSVPATIFGPSSLPTNGVGDYWISPVKGATSYSWVVPGGWIIASNSGTSIVASAGTSGGYVKVKATNSCGSSADQTKFVQVGSGGGDPLSVFPRLQVMTYPNPSQNYIEINVNRQGTAIPELSLSNKNLAPKEADEVFLLKLFNLRGELVYSKQMKGDQEKIKITNLQKGQYVLHLVAGNNKIISEKIFIDK